MKLLSKQEITQQKSLDRTREVQEGMKLAKKVDSLRELASVEELNLRKVREQSLANVREEINKEIARKEALTREADEAEERLIRLADDTELIEVRRRLKERGDEQEAIAEDQLKREIDVSKRENDIHDSQAAVFLREKEVAVAEKKVTQLLSDADTAYELAAADKQAAQTIRAQAESFAENETRAIREKQDTLSISERELRLREKKVEEDTKDIINERAFLADQRQTLERGFAELRRKQQYG